MRNTSTDNHIISTQRDAQIPMNPEEFEQDVYAEYDENDSELYADEFDAEYASSTHDFSNNAKAAATYVDVGSIVALTARLSQLLAQEVDLLADMKVKEIDALQKEKINILDALEAHKKLLDQNPDLLRHMDDAECLELAQTVEIFQSVMKENHRRLLIAKEVNRQVVEAISDAVKETSKNAAYDNMGLREQSSGSFSMTVNQTA